MDLNDFLTDFNQGAAPDAINALETAVGKLPDDYTAFMLECNGGEGVFGVLWSVEEVPPFNEDYQVKICAPGLILFGSNGGGEGFAFDTRNNFNVVRIPFIGMDLKYAKPIASTFTAFLKQASTGND